MLYVLLQTILLIPVIGEFTTTIYLEGWDFNVIDEELSHQFNLGLTFEINSANSETNSSSNP